MSDKYTSRTFSDIYEIEYKEARFTVGKTIRGGDFKIALITEKDMYFETKGYAAFAIYTVDLRKENAEPKLWREIPSAMCVPTFNQDS